MEPKAISTHKNPARIMSLEQNCTATNAERAQIIQNSTSLLNCQLANTPEKAAAALNNFFAKVSASGEIPSVEKMALALGTVRQVIWEWEQGTLGREMADIVKKAKEILGAIDAELVASRKIEPITYIFRAKNYYGMKDKVEYSVERRDVLGSGKTVDELEAKWLNSIPICTDSEVE
jgi:hypothetical protein